MSGKGDDRRPTQVSDGEFESNWRRTFGNRTKNRTARGALERAARRIGQLDLVQEPYTPGAPPPSPEAAKRAARAVYGEIAAPASPRALPCPMCPSLGSDTSAHVQQWQPCEKHRPAGPGHVSEGPGHTSVSPT